MPASRPRYVPSPKRFSASPKRKRSEIKENPRAFQTEVRKLRQTGRRLVAQTPRSVPRVGPRRAECRPARGPPARLHADCGAPCGPCVAGTLGCFPRARGLMKTHVRWPGRVSLQFSTCTCCEGVNGSVSDAHRQVWAIPASSGRHGCRRHRAAVLVAVTRTPQPGGLEPEVHGPPAGCAPDSPQAASPAGCVPSSSVKADEEEEVGKVSENAQVLTATAGCPHRATRGSGTGSVSRGRQRRRRPGGRGAPLTARHGRRPRQERRGCFAGGIFSRHRRCGWFSLRR